MAAVAWAQFPSPYCGVTFQYNSDGNMITRVQFAGIDQTSPFTSGTTPSMEDFLAVTGTVTRGQSYPISVKGPSSTFPSDVVVFIDWNQNQNFNDPGESYALPRLADANPANAFTVTGTVNVPANALTGTTRMRILKNTSVAANSDPAAPNTITDACSANLRSGQLEDYTIIVNPGTPAVQPCTPAIPGPNVGDVGCVTFNYGGQTVYYPTVRAADGNVWLQQNLGASRIAVAKNDSLAYGHMFQWGRWDDGHQIRTSATGAVPAPNNPSGLGTGIGTFYTGTSSAAWWSPNALSDTWAGTAVAEASATNGVDPCKAIGPTWSIPSETQWTDVIADEAITSPDLAFASNLKLTVGGSRSSSNGSYTFVGVRGYYWSNTTSSTGAKYLYYSAAITNPSAGSPRGGGASVRCISVPPVMVDSVAVNIQDNAAPVIVGLGNTLQAEATVYPATVSQNVNWSIVPVTGTATINATGLVTAQTAGTVWAKAVSAANTSGKDSVLITIHAICTPMVAITSNAGLNICEGTSVTFNTVAQNEGNAPVYEWKKNNVTVGGNTASYTDNALNSGDVITCALTGNAVCDTSGTVNSNTLTITVNNVYNTAVSEAICPGETYTFYGTPLHAAGTYSHTLTSVGGCDSTITLTLTLKVLPVPTVGADGNQLSTGSFGSYQWLLNGQPAPGINNAQSYTATQSGQYTVTVTNAAGCTATSATYTHGMSGIDESVWSGLSVFPNPTNGVLNIQLPATATGWGATLLNVDGRTLKNITSTHGNLQTLDLGGLPAGIYWLRIQAPDGNLKTVKIVRR